MKTKNKNNDEYIFMNKFVLANNLTSIGNAEIFLDLARGLSDRLRKYEDRQDVVSNEDDSSSGEYLLEFLPALFVLRYLN